jgi:hypothetical protein
MFAAHTPDRVFLFLSATFPSSDTFHGLLQDLIQIPALFGSKKDVPTSNFLPRTLNNFRFTPASSNYRVPPGWQGKLTLLFVLKDGTEYSKVHGYVRSDRGPGLRLPQKQPGGTAKSSWTLGG